MPNQPKTTARPVRLDDQLWAELGQRAAEQGSDRSAILRKLVSWWLRHPGAKMPPRPSARDATAAARARAGPRNLA